jgi:serine/threonine protein kinase
MEKADDNLWRWLAERVGYRGDRLTLDDFKDLAVQLAEGLAFLHGQKPKPVIHRELKRGVS